MPASLFNIVMRLVDITNIYTVGTLGDPAKIGGVGMGNMIMALFGLSIFSGLNSALDTLVTGAGNLTLCGVYLNRGRLVILCCFVPIVVIVLHTEDIMIALSQDPKVS